MKLEIYPLILVSALLAGCGGGASSDGSNDSTGTAPSSKPADTVPPSVSITGPTTGASYSTGAPC